MDKPIYFSKIEFKNNFLQDCEGTMLLNLVEKELSYQLVKRHRKNEKILFSYGVKIKDDDLPELLQYCNALDFEPYRKIYMVIYHDEKHIWPNEKLYKYLIQKYFGHKKFKKYGIYY